MKSTIRLFRAIPIKTKKKGKLTKEILERTIKYGFVLSEEVIGNCQDLDNLIDEVKEVIGLSNEQANSAFHKSWKKIKEASIEQLVVEQMIHYFTTYGLEELGLYSEESVYIPAEKLELPEIDVDKIFLTLIKGYTKAELKEKLTKLLQSGIALGDETTSDVTDVATYLELSGEEIEAIKNKEVRAMLYDYLGKVPKGAVEFLRFCVYQATDKTLLIKDRATIEYIKDKRNINIAGLFVKYKSEYGLKGLAEIFYRFKPLFLAFRTNSKLKTLINKIRKLAKKYHKPMSEDYLNSVTAKLNRGESLDKLKSKLKEVNVFRKIRLAYALKYRTKDVSSILYKIRNGKGFATDFEFDNQAEAEKALDIVVSSIAKDIKIKGKKVYIPENIEYTLPATQKQFTGVFPSGTCVKLLKDMVVGVYWKNTKGRIDLDLSLVNIDSKYGWDAEYRDGNRSILFSGDVTDAPRGASELFYVKRQVTKSFLLVVNYYNFDSDIKVPIKIFVAQEQAGNMRENYMVNPNNMVAVSESSINRKQKVLGLLVVKTNGSRFYFSDTYLGSSISSSKSDFAEHTRQYLLNYYQNSINLADILEKAGAEMVNEKNCEINLSPEKLEKDSIIKLLYG